MSKRPIFRLIPYRLLPGVDWVLITITLSLIALGILTLWGASSLGEGPVPLIGEARKQCLWAMMGLLTLPVLILFDYRRLRRSVWVLYGVLLVLLVGLLIKAHAIKGARSWYDLGFVNFQPSEAGKIIIVLALAHYLAGRALVFRGLRQTAIPLLIVGGPILLIMAQPDLGTAVVLVPISGAMFWVAGIRKSVVVLFVFVGVAGALLAYPHFRPHQKERIKTFLNPGADPLKGGWHIHHAKTALGSGELLGKGWGQGTQTRFRFLPEYKTDFIFPTIGEQFGMLGCSLVLVLLTLVIWRLARLAAVTQELFGLFVIAGLTAMLATHIIFNVGMSVGLMPVTGLPLPFFSYGGSFMLTCMVSIGLALSIGARRDL